VAQGDKPPENQHFFAASTPGGSASTAILGTGVLGCGWRLSNTGQVQIKIIVPGVYPAKKIIAQCHAKQGEDDMSRQVHEIE
jgi:hypothetical protein